MSSITVLLKFTLLFTVVKVQAVYRAKCRVKLDVSACYSIDPPDTIPQTSCVEEKACQKTFNISYIEVGAYSPEIVTDILQTCCGTCTRTLQVHTMTSPTQINQSVVDTSHFIFPVLGQQDTRRMYTMQFIPLIEAPHVYYVTRADESPLKGVIISCVGMWPLILVCLLMVVIAGFICWVLEHENNSKFSGTFYQGWFEGIWWSFITMTTVGYGDRIPKTILARLFCMGWILIGMTVFSLVCATLTSKILSFNIETPPEMADRKVGVLRHRLYEAILIAKNNGVLRHVEADNTTHGIDNLVQQLNAGVVDGFVIDRYTLLLFYDHFANDPYHQHNIEYIRDQTTVTQLTHAGTYYYGVLIKNEEEYQFLHDFLKDNNDVVKTCNRLLMSNLSRAVNMRKEKHPMFSTKGQLFLPTFVVVLVINISIFCFGVFYEFKRQSTPNDNKQVTVSADGQMVTWRT